LEPELLLIFLIQFKVSSESQNNDIGCVIISFIDIIIIIDVIGMSLMNGSNLEDDAKDERDESVNW
jgi:hypothetical protein